MPFVIADVELALDQVGNARAGPQGRLIAQSLWSAQEQFYQPLPIARAEPRFPSGPSGLPQRDCAVQVKLPDPPRYGLPNDLHPPRHFGLIQSFVEQSHRGEPPLLQCIEIARNSGGIAHARLYRFLAPVCSYIMRGSINTTRTRQPQDRSCLANGKIVLVEVSQWNSGIRDVRRDEHRKESREYCDVPGKL